MRHNLIRLYMLLASGALALAVAACSGDAEPADTSTGESGPLLVVASIYPMQFFAERLGGDRVEVAALVPPGVEGHTFELTPGDLRTIGGADVIAMNGLELEPWLERALESLGDDVSGIVIEAADAGAALGYEDHQAEEGEGEEEEAEGGEEGDHGHGKIDPHFWLDPLRAITQAERIAEALVEADPTGADLYRANLASLTGELRALHAEFESGLSSCAHREFITSHAAYGYLALAYDLEQVAVSGLSPGVEPSAQRLASIVDRINELGIDAVLIEPVLSGSNEQVLASETGAGIYQIHPLDGVTLDELAEHGDYFSLMRDSLNSLRAAMDCS